MFSTKKIPSMFSTSVWYFSLKKDKRDSFVQTFAVALHNMAACIVLNLDIISQSCSYSGRRFAIRFGARPVCGSQSSILYPITAAACPETTETPLRPGREKIRSWCCWVDLAAEHWTQSACLLTQTEFTNVMYCCAVRFVAKSWHHEASKSSLVNDGG